MPLFMFRSARSWWLIGAAALCLVAGWMWLAYRSLYPPFTPPPVPVPNGYDKLLAAAALLHPETALYEEKQPAELAAIVAENERALDLARQGLAMETGVPLDWEAGHAGTGNLHLDQIGQLRELSRAFTAASMHAQNQGNYAEAAAYTVDMIDLSEATRKGGVLIDAILAVVINGLAMSEIALISNHLNAIQCQSLLDRLVAFDSGAIDFEELKARDLHFGLRGRSLAERLSLAANGLLKLDQSSIDAIQNALTRQSANTRLAMALLAIRIHQLEHGEPPASLDDLVPDILAEVPRDPFSAEGQQPLVYRREGDSFVLYSVGVNGVDDGGVSEEDPPSGDLMLQPAADASTP